MANDADAIDDAVKVFGEVKARVEAYMGVSSVAGVVSRVLKDEVERQGFLVSGEEYIVHGVGYTVTTERGALVHIDSCGDKDCFKTYDIRMYLEGVLDPAPSLEEIASGCDRIAQSGRLEKLSRATFALNDTQTMS